ncbi:MAG: hypothetical protein H7834_16550 [Magnetococcus sp. YQC-9]
MNKDQTNPIADANDLDLEGIAAIQADLAARLGLPSAPPIQSPHDRMRTDLHYETMPARLPYELIFEMGKEAWNKLVQHALDQKMNNREIDVYMWRHLYRLHSWFMIHIEEDNGFRPYAGLMEDKPTLLMFTSYQLAEDFIKQQGVDKKYAHLSVNGYLIPSTLQHLEQYQGAGLQWIHFNNGIGLSFGGSLQVLEEGYRWMLKHDPIFSTRSSR